MDLLPELVKQKSGGPRVVRTWRVEKSRDSAVTLASFLRDLGKIAWFFNLPSKKWQDDFIKMNAIRKERELHASLERATPWGFNYINSSLNYW